MKPAPEGLYDNVLVFGGKGSASSPPAAEIGGTWRTPNYPLSYLLAARMTLERAVEAGHVAAVVLPVAYLQRHAFELGLKSLIDLAYDVADDEERIGRVQQGQSHEDVPVRYAQKDHGLGKLISELEKALTAVKYDPVPRELVELADVLATVEAEVPDRLRYGRVGKAKDPQLPSLPEARPFEVGQMQERLEAVFARYLVYRQNALDFEADEWNLLEALAVESEACFQQLLRLGVEP